MDTFIDKLAQKLTAQEMINANSAADAAELTMLREQMAEYEDLLKDIQEENEKGKDSTARMERSAVAIDQSTAGLTQSASLMEEQVAQVKEQIGRMSAGADRLEEEIRRLSETSGSSVSFEEEVSKLNMGMTSLGDSINRLNESATNISDGVIGLSEGTFHLGEGLSQMDKGLERLNESSTRLEQAVERNEKSVSMAAQTVVRAEQSVTKAEQGAAKTDELIRTAMAKIEQMQAGNGNTEEVKALLAELQKVQNDQFAQLTDHVHKENVKVYRNVQAVVIDENDKQNENSGKSFGYLSVRTNAILVVSLVSLLASCAGLVFQILVYLHIL